MNPGNLNPLKVMVDIAQILADNFPLSNHGVETVVRAAKVLELGFVGINDFLLQKWMGHARMTEAERREIIQLELQYSKEILSKLSQYQQSLSFLQARYEHWDGSGFPKGLRGNEIPVGAQILAVAETLGSWLSPGPDQDSFTLEEAIGEIQEKSGAQFGPKVVETLVRVYQKGLLR